MMVSSHNRLITRTFGRPQIPAQTREPLGIMMFLEIKREKTMVNITTFDKEKLKPTETVEKVTLPTADDIKNEAEQQSPNQDISIYSNIFTILFKTPCMNKFLFLDDFFTALPVQDSMLAPVQFGTGPGEN